MKKTLIAAGTSMILLLGACSKDPDNKDFRKETEKFLVGSKVEDEAKQKFTDAKCEDPGSTAIDTKYTCTATGADGLNYTFSVRIDKKNSFLVESVNLTDAAGTPTPAGEDTTPTVAATQTTAA